MMEIVTKKIFTVLYMMSFIGLLAYFKADKKYSGTFVVTAYIFGMLATLFMWIMWENW